MGNFSNDGAAILHDYNKLWSLSDLYGKPEHLSRCCEVCPSTEITGHVPKRTISK